MLAISGTGTGVTMLQEAQAECHDAFLSVLGLCQAEEGHQVLGKSTHFLSDMLADEDCYVSVCSMLAASEPDIL